MLGGILLLAASAVWPPDPGRQLDETSANTFRQPKESSCPQLKSCNCSRDGIYVTVNCIHLKNFGQLMSVVREEYSHRPIGHIYISRSSIDALPADAFANLTVTKIFVRRSSVGRVDDRVFRGVRGLVQLRFDNMKYANFPSSVSGLRATLRALWMERGQLRAIGQQLTNFSRMRVISLKKNQIGAIHPRAFYGMTELIDLDLSNNSIKTLHPSTFDSLRSLRNLNLMGNRLESVKGLFRNHRFTIEMLLLQRNNIENIDNLTDVPLYSLHTLYLTENPLRVITEDSFGMKFPQLRFLYLSETQLSRLDSSAFQYMTNLQRVMLNGNQLSVLDPNVFANIQSLHTVSLAENRISGVKNLFARTPGLTTLFLSHNRIDDVRECFRSNSRLTSLFLDHNRLPRIYGRTFENNNQLVSLSLDYNQIEYVETDSFYGLTSLTKLYFSRNKIDGLNDSLRLLPRLRELYLNDNRLVGLGAGPFRQNPYLNIVDLSYNRLISVEKAFAPLQNLQILKINHNFINTLTEESFSPRAPLRNLQLRNNPWQCDCRIEWLVLRNYVKLDTAVCWEPQWLKSTRISSLKLDQVKTWKTDCPDRCHCLCRPNSTDFYIEVDCSHRQLTRVPDTLPERTNCLDLSRNEILEIPKFLSNFSRLEHLLLRFNNLTTLPRLANLHLRSLTLSNNRLARFPFQSITAAYLQTISLSENPWICDCQTLPFVRWMLSEKDKIVDLNQTKCGSNNDKFQSQKIVSLTEPSLCPSLIALYSTVAVGVALILLTVAGGKIVYNKYRMYIRVWFYSRGFSCFKEDDLDENKQFDAFVSYSSLDESFVLFKLVPTLESGEKPYYLCLHSRNFVPGSYIQDNIINAVKASKRTILVLSENFLSSEWCRLEFKSAHHQVLEERLNRLIVIVLGDLPAGDDIDPELLLYLKTTTYLRWGEKNFWNKLRYAMPKTPCDITLSESTPLLGNYD